MLYGFAASIVISFRKIGQILLTKPFDDTSRENENRITTTFRLYVFLAARKFAAFSTIAESEVLLFTI